MPKAWVPRVDFTQSPTVAKFMQDDTRVRIIMGPVGSGKTHGCCVEIYRRACMQKPSPHDGLRRFKAAVVRNTGPELSRTTIETWLAIFPEDKCGMMRHTAPIRHKIFFPSENWEPGISEERNRGTPGLDLIVEFFAMDKPEQKKALLSYEATLFYFNEIREIEQSVIDLSTTRVGRYPSMAKGGVFPTGRFIIGDTNPPDDDHMLYYRDKVDRPHNWKFFHQPPALLEAVETPAGTHEPKEKQYDTIEVWSADEVVSAAGKKWIVNPGAENLYNLPPGDPKMAVKLDGYYLDLAMGKSLSFIQNYGQGKYVYVQEGKPVIPEFNEETMVTDDLPILEGVPIEGGFDVGGGTLSPACVFGQRHPRGMYLVHGEVSVPEIGLKRFAAAVKAEIARVAPARDLTTFWSDPAGARRDELLEVVTFDHLRMRGLNAQPAQSNKIALRIEATKGPMLRYYPEEKMPGILIHRRCRKLIKGLNGAWNYKRTQITGEERYHTAPTKNEFSHTCDALGYWFMGGGEIRELTHTPVSQRHQKVYQAKTDFPVL